ncbi:N-acetylneuraminate synthase [Psychrosphaera ytuae]|uniref:N-acetylneuraminate synthase n=1 Tax=Psychrosphaera ytuae TaxID=2820710 RepID=A0A975DBP1_9GAMM|nr:N-acetylneuraminate synthase [Psychrosphaera ytuae]QTH63804.1 N-acetylneuraminate synthase [Psychrosphaera ytuae]
MNNTNKTLIIAEAGVNHNGDKQMAFDLIDAAAEAGADVVKFQTFKAHKLVTQHAQQAEYQVANSGKKESQLAMLQALELEQSLHFELQAAAEANNIEFLSTAFDDDSLDFLVKEVGVKRLKVPSGELTNAPFVLKHAQAGLPLIISTGMATMSDIEQALAVIAFGGLNPKSTPDSIDSCWQAYHSEEGQSFIQQNVTVLHCTTEYPAPPSEINLRVMETFRRSFNTQVGYSDHSAGIAIPIAAAALGAEVIEKHFTLDKTLPGPDHKASLEPSELKQMVDGIRVAEQALGVSVKSVQPSEFKNSFVARKSLVATKPIKVGETFTKENLGVMRPGSGLSPALYWQMLDTVSNIDYQVGDLIE